jgi:hypothetical protein
MCLGDAGLWAGERALVWALLVAVVVGAWPV